jgi:hypothetical protein
MMSTIAPERPQDDPRKGAIALVEAADAAGLTLRVTGGIAVVVLCPSASHEPLARPYKDLDLVGLAKERKALQKFLVAQGYEAAERFNLLHGDSQLMFGDPATGRQLDVFLDTLKMCHELRFADRLRLHATTLDPADLLLSKLQVVQTTERDLLDIIAIMADHEVDHDRVADVTSRDWGWWRTVSEVLSKAEGHALSLTGWDRHGEFQRRATALREAIDAAPKSMKWKARARVGDRVRWYELPEDTRSET